ncbi:MAG TPA: histidine phosphatase family protein [Devosiaceae bacterium]|jgi:broad specificity phosphatase PhoE|nr:histidine phosphatase family protein [Devosiaceae bacterium]
MTTTFFLVRHAAHDNVGGFLAGRMPGVRLGVDGRAQAGRLAERMRRETFSRIYVSPRERAAETAAAIATVSPVPIEEAAELDEIEFGAWSGKDFATLNADPAWRHWNAWRSLARTPGGETMLDVERRAADFMETLVARFPEDALVLVSHADVIRALVGHVLGLALDLWQRFDISPASITTLIVGDWGARLLGVNEVVP